MDSQRTTYVGIDLGGARGKTTAVVRLTAEDAPESGVLVEEACTRRDGVEPWRDEVLVDYLLELGEQTIVAIDAPLTSPACVRCRLEVCPGLEACTDAAVVWLRTSGAALVQSVELSDSERIAVVPSATSARSGIATYAPPPPPRRTPSPYVHRCAELLLHFQHGLIPRDFVGRANGPVAARAIHLRRRLASHGFRLDENLLEVSPRATVQALCGDAAASGYKHDADPWETRAAIVEGLADLGFAPRSRLSKESVLRNDHCFEALLSGYTAYLRTRERWTRPAGDPDLWAEDGWIWAPTD